MNHFHLNLGLVFSRPYESDYSILRRFLVANPGIPLSTLKAVLRLQNDGQSSFVERIKALQPASPYPQPDISCHGHARQCPECAKRLYHTDIYNIEWLTRCPIHQCMFTSTCPVCGLRWPDEQEMAKSDCPGCSRVRIKELIYADCVEFHHGIYRTIGDIYDFVSYKMEDELHLSSTEGSSIWWREIGIGHQLFPACQVLRHPRYSRAIIKKLNIVFTPVRHSSFPLTYYKGALTRDGANYRRKRHRCEAEDLCPRTLKADFVVMFDIIKKIASRTNKKHRPYLSCYRHIRLVDLVNSPDPCLYCLALSLWFFNVASKKYGDAYHIDTHDYPFCEDIGIYGIHSISEFDLLSDDEESYKINGSFLRWSYQRSLEWCFLDILRFVEILIAKIRIYRQRAVHEYSAYIPKRARDSSGFDYLIDRSDKVMTIFFEQAHPIKDSLLPRIYKSHEICQEHRQYMKEIIDGNVYFDLDVPSDLMTYSQFLDLHEQFRVFLKTKLVNYCRGSTPIRKIW
jgi:hypothetical protein